MKTIEVTVQELQAATRPNVYRNRKKYTRKDKHRNKKIDDWFVYFSIKEIKIKVMTKVDKIKLAAFGVFFTGVITLVVYNALTIGCKSCFSVM
jgi:hypothetical protein